jgi:glyoxalase/bleomycin resistance protein/dioxygenase superfamily protein
VDLDPPRAWYERLLGRPPDLIPNETEVAWQLASTAWIYVVVDAERAGRGLVTALVGDLDALVAEVAARGIAPEGTEELAGVGRKAAFADPAGNRIVFAQVGR